MGVYVIYDELAKQAAPMFLARSDELALRQFEAQRGHIPEAVLRDLRVYRIGRFDLATMAITEAFPVIIDSASLLDSAVKE